MISEKDAYWVAGFLEGEGCFQYAGGRRLVTACQVQKEPLERLVLFCGGSLYLKKGNPEKNAQAAWIWQLSGKPAVDLMHLVYPIMSPKRQNQISKALKR